MEAIVVTVPMVARPPGPNQFAVQRSGDDAITGNADPLEVLLPSSGALVPAPAPAPHRVLALAALRLRQGLRGPGPKPVPWRCASFAREVELIRRHLAPLRSRRSLTASFRREAFQSIEAEPRPDEPLEPIRAAYAIRWLELGSGADMPAWTSLIAAE